MGGAAIWEYSHFHQDTGEKERRVELCLCTCVGVYNVHTVFLRSDATATIYVAARFVRLLFEGGVYFWKAWRHQQQLDKYE